jgi:hypothetical protein
MYNSVNFNTIQFSSLWGILFLSWACKFYIFYLLKKEWIRKEHEFAQSIICVGWGIPVLSMLLCVHSHSMRDKEERGGSNLSAQIVLQVIISYCMSETGLFQCVHFHVDVIVTFYFNLVTYESVNSRNEWRKNYWKTALVWSNTAVIIKNIVRFFEPPAFLVDLSASWGISLMLFFVNCIFQYLFYIVLIFQLFSMVNQAAFLFLYLI